MVSAASDRRAIRQRPARRGAVLAQARRLIAPAFGLGLLALTATPGVSAQTAAATTTATAGASATPITPTTPTSAATATPISTGTSVVATVGAATATPISTGAPGVVTVGGASPTPGGGPAAATATPTPGMRTLLVVPRPTNTPTPTPTPAACGVLITPASASLSLQLTGADASVEGTLGTSRAGAVCGGGGWRVDASTTSFTSGARSLPADALRVTGVDVDVLLGAAPNNNLTYPVTIVAGAAPTRIFRASGSSGVGLFDLTPGVRLFVPADAYAGSYSGEVTLTLVAGP
jgi:hypothetical protein